MAMAGFTEFRAWGELIPDALGQIFHRLSLQEILTVIPRVCKSWGRVVSGPYCWQEIDILEWSQHNPKLLDKMLEMLIARSQGSVLKLSVTGLHTDSMFYYIADHASSLQRLELPRSELSDAVVEDIAPKLPNLTFLDLSYCNKICIRAIEAFGKNCKFLVGLRRRIHPFESCQQGEAYAIAKTMPKLQRLEAPYLLSTTEGVLEILAKCKDLEYLDIRGCWDVNLDEEYMMEKYSSLTIVGPYIDVLNGSDDFSDNSDSSTYWEYFMDNNINAYEGGSDDNAIWEEDEQGLEGLEVRFYGSGLQENDGYGWPPSP